MKIQTVFFATYRDLAGTGSLEVELAEGATVATLIDTLRSEACPALPEDPAVAVNLTYARANEPLSDGDEVALIPPVAGG